jgi:hypothetical protein
MPCLVPKRYGMPPLCFWCSWFPCLLPWWLLQWPREGSSQAGAAFSWDSGRKKEAPWTLTASSSPASCPAPRRTQDRPWTRVVLVARQQIQDRPLIRAVSLVRSRTQDRPWTRMVLVARQRIQDRLWTRMVVVDFACATPHGPARRWPWRPRSRPFWKGCHDSCPDSVCRRSVPSAPGLHASCPGCCSNDPGGDRLNLVPFFLRALGERR